ncbi:MAG: LuxR family transcriptional regulator [Polaromonas sp.]|nr:LuxR family transcriptional regulator [Polaromonas sp.]
MRSWTVDAVSGGGARLPGQVLAGIIGELGQARFASTLLDDLHPLVPAASWSVYQTGRGCAPRLFMSASRGVPDTTRACWQAYLSGPYLSDRTLTPDAGASAETGDTRLCHITAAEVPAEHRARVYEAHGVAERVSVVQGSGHTLFAVNFYRHQHQHAFSDAQLGDFEAVAPALLALTQKHLALGGARGAVPADTTGKLTHWQRRLQALEPALTARELAVCARLLLGMTQDGIACDLGLRLPTVKTYRNRAFARLGIHFRNQLFALLLEPPTGKAG